MPAPEILWDVAVVALVVAAQAILLRSARREARTSYGDAFDRCERRFADDVVRRARRGSAPDWSRYRSELDRYFEPVDDRLRVLAAAALATGLGGTILALMGHLLAAFGRGVEPETVVPGMGVALFGSLAGVTNHLAIVLGVLPGAERRFRGGSEELVHRLHETEEANPPADTLVQSFREELSGLRELLGSQFASAFTEAVPEFPRVVERLAEVVEREAATVDGAVGELRESSKLVASSSKRLRPAADKLAAVSDDLVALPERLAGALSATRQQWIEELHQEHRTSNEELRELLAELNRTWANREHELLERVGAIARAAEHLPQEFADRLRSMSDDLGTRFGQEARHYTRELADHLDKKHERLLGQVRDHQREWQNSLGEAVRRVLEGLSAEVEDRLAERLEAVSGELSGAAGRLTEVSSGLAEAHEGWRRSHEEALAGWSGVGDRVTEAAGVLAGGEADLERAVAALDAGAGHLERIARLTGEFEAALQASLREVTARHLEELQPVYGEVSRLVEELQATRGRFDGILGEQSRFIRGLIEQILAGRGAAAAGGPGPGP